MSLNNKLSHPSETSEARRQLKCILLGPKKKERKKKRNQLTAHFWDKLATTFCSCQQLGAGVHDGLVLCSAVLIKPGKKPVLEDFSHEEMSSA